MPTITIRIDVPEGAGIDIEDAAGEAIVPSLTNEAPAAPPASAHDVERYWREYLSDNGRELYAAAAAIERDSGIGFTLNDVAERMGREYGSAQSIHRTTGRSARRWKDDTGKEAPIRLDWMEYTWDDSERGMRTSYQLPEGVAAQVAQL